MSVHYQFIGRQGFHRRGDLDVLRESGGVFRRSESALVTENQGRIISQGSLLGAAQSLLKERKSETEIRGEWDKGMGFIGTTDRHHSMALPTSPSSRDTAAGESCFNSLPASLYITPFHTDAASIIHVTGVVETNGGREGMTSSLLSVEVGRGMSERGGVKEEILPPTTPVPLISLY